MINYSFSLAGSSVPPTPQMGRRKLELLPRSTSASSQATPLSSPKSAGFTASKSSPFGAAKYVISNFVLGSQFTISSLN